MKYEELKALGFVPLRNCSICNTPVGYRVDPYYVAATFNSDCKCAPTMPDSTRLATHSELESLKGPEGRVFPVASDNVKDALKNLLLVCDANGLRSLPFVEDARKILDALDHSCKEDNSNG